MPLYAVDGLYALLALIVAGVLVKHVPARGAGDTGGVSRMRPTSLAISQPSVV